MLSQRPGLRLHVALRCAERLLELDRVGEASREVAHWLAAPPGVQAYDLDSSEAQAIAWQVARAAGDKALAERLRQQALQQLQNNLARLPEAWREDYLLGVPAHRLFGGDVPTAESISNPD